MRYVTVGRHPFTQVQASLLRKAGLEQEVARVVQVNNPAEVVELARQRGAEAIVVQALPLPLLAQLLAAANRAGIAVYSFRMETFATVPEGQSCPPETEIERPAEGGYRRCVRTAALQRLRRIVIEAEDVVSP